MNSPNQNVGNRLGSPSNVTTVILIGFLFVGHTTDWKMLHGRSSKSARSVAEYSLEHSTRAQPPHNRSTGTHVADPGASPKSVIADSRAAPHDGNSRQELD